MSFVVILLVVVVIRGGGEDVGTLREGGGLAVFKVMEGLRTLRTDVLLRLVMFMLLVVAVSLEKGA